MSSHYRHRAALASVATAHGLAAPLNRSGITGGYSLGEFEVMAKARAHRSNRELFDRAVRLVGEQSPHYLSDWAAISAIAPKFG